VEDITKFRTPDVEVSFVGQDNSGASRLYIGDEITVAEDVEVRSHLSTFSCINDPPRMESLAPLILLDPDLLTTFPLPHTLVIPPVP